MLESIGTAARHLRRLRETQGDSSASSGTRAYLKLPMAVRESLWLSQP